MQDRLIQSPLNYTGGKYKLLPQILPFFPKKIEIALDLFFGGANVGLNLNSKKLILNDKEKELIRLFEYFKKHQNDKIFKDLENLIDEFNLSKSYKMGYEFYNCNSTKGLASYNKENFLKLRNSYNKDKNTLKLFLLIVFSFNNQLRFNSKNEFNLPCGKRDFNLNMQQKLRLFIEALQNYHLLENKNKTTHLGTKDARVKLASLEDFGLIKRKEKLISEQGYELLKLIKSQAYKIDNDLLQIDLISMFFFKMSLKFSKSENLLQKYLEVFALYNGCISKKLFLFLPLINNFENTKEFIKLFSENQILDFLVFKDYKENLEQFLIDLENKNYDKMNYFHTAKGEQSAKDIKFNLKLFLEFRENKDKNIFLELLKAKKDEKFYRFKEFYLAYISKEINQENKIKDLINFCGLDSLQDFGKRFFKLIFKARIINNLKDYADLNERYLNLCGIFEFNLESININEIFKLILKHSKYKDILKTITNSKISKELLREYFNDEEFKIFFKSYEINSLKELKNYAKKENLQKIHNLLKYDFTKEKIMNILELFEDRKNDEKIASLVTKEATISTIFEHIIAISWCYIDDFNLEHILNAGLSLDSKFLPKSHAVGGEADFIYHYDKHSLMIEATLTQKTNQRRAEMESVSRHLGNLLLNLEQEKRERSFAIFIAPYLDKNVLNDFRSRIYCYFENETNFIKGMKILPLSTKDLKDILNSNLNYKQLLPKIYEILNDKEDFGSKWYKENVIKITKKAGQ